MFPHHLYPCQRRHQLIVFILLHEEAITDDYIDGHINLYYVNVSHYVDVECICLGTMLNKHDFHTHHHTHIKMHQMPNGLIVDKAR